jgi:hypothetical protein
MNALNAILTALADWFFLQFAGGPTWLPLLIVSGAAGLFASFVFRFTSRQDLLRRDAELIQAQLLAMKLFRDDLGTMCGSLGRLLRYTALRLWHSLPPVIIMTVPFVLLLVQLARWYEYAPLIAGDESIVVLRLSKEAWSDVSGISPEPSDAFTLQTPSLRDPHEHAIYWRFLVADPILTKMRWKLPQQTVEKSVAVSNDRQRLTAVDAERPGPNLTSQLLHPGEPGFSSSDVVRGVEIYHPQRSTPILGLDLPWWATFLLFSMLTAVLVGRCWKIQF